jgi:ABC-2 type transport system permease protein
MPAVALLYAGASAYAIWNGSRWAATERAAVERFQKLDTARLNRFRDRAAAMERQIAQKTNGPIPVYEFTWGPKRPNWPSAWAPQSAILPPGPLAAFMIGQRDLQPLAFTGYRLAPTVRPAGNPLVLLHGPFDFGFVTLYLLPLAILAVSFNVLTSERESGIAGLLLSQPVSGRQLLFRRVVLRAGFLVAVHALCTLAATGSATDRNWMLGVAWIAASLAYASFWAALVFWTNAKGRNSARAATVLGGVWLLALVVVPAAVHTVASLIHPMPSRIESVRAKREAAEHAKGLADDGLRSAFLARHPEYANRTYPDQGRRYLLGHARWEAQEKLFADRERVFEERLAGQHQVAALGALLSPAAILRSILLDLSGSGEARYRHFLTQVTAFQQETRRFFWPLIYEDREFRSEDYARVPQFRFREEDPLEVVRRVVPGIAVLALLVFAPALAGYQTARRTSA